MSESNSTQPGLIENPAAALGSAVGAVVQTAGSIAEGMRKKASAGVRSLTGKATKARKRTTRTTKVAAGKTTSKTRRPTSATRKKSKTSKVRPSVRAEPEKTAARKKPRSK